MSNITKNDCELEKQFDNINTDKFDKTPTPCSSLLSDNKSKHYIQYDNNSSKRKIRLRSNTLFAFQVNYIKLRTIIFIQIYILKKEKTFTIMILISSPIIL